MGGREGLKAPCALSHTPWGTQAGADNLTLTRPPVNYFDEKKIMFSSNAFCRDPPVMQTEIKRGHVFNHNLLLHQACLLFCTLVILDNKNRSLYFISWFQYISSICYVWVFNTSVYFFQTDTLYLKKPQQLCSSHILELPLRGFFSP